MSLIQNYIEALPYIDPAPSPSTASKIESWIRLEMSLQHNSVLHPLIETRSEPRTIPSIADDHARFAKFGVNYPHPTKDQFGNQLGIDLKRYESVQPPNLDGLTQEEQTQAWTDVLRRARIASQYLCGRIKTLDILAASSSAGSHTSNGAKAWLTSNQHIEIGLRHIETELRDTNIAHDVVNAERKASQQEQYQSEIKRLENAWKSRIDGIVSVLAATERLNVEIDQIKKGIV